MLLLRVNFRAIWKISNQNLVEILYQKISDSLKSEWLFKNQI